MSLRNAEFVDINVVSVAETYSILYWPVFSIGEVACALIDL